MTSQSVTWYTNEVWTILDFISRKDQLVLNPEYQRGPVWSKKKSQKLIDSILRGWGIGLIILNGTAKQVGELFEPQYEVIDGQQRIRAIFKFLDEKKGIEIPEYGNNYKILGSPYDLNGRKWNDPDFPQNVKTHFNAFKIKVQPYVNKPEWEVAQIFQRVQEGMPLNSAEIVNAIIGDIRNQIRDLSDYSFIQKSKTRLSRFNKKWVTANIVFHELNDFTGRGEIKDASRDAIIEMYNQNVGRKRKTRSAIARVKRIFRYLDSKFGEHASLIKSNPDLITIYMVASFLDKKYALRSNSTVDWTDFTETFLLNVSQTRKLIKNNRPIPNNLQGHSRYETNRLRESKDTIKARFDFMIEKFLEEFPSLENIDEQRLFDEYQKRVIYQRDGHQCQDPQDAQCQGETNFSNGEVDHITPHSAGGTTTVDNGQWLCQHCNRVKHAN